MCRAFGIRPLFILRYAPKSYINDIIRAGGYAMIFEWQLYPLGREALAQAIRTELPEGGHPSADSGRDDREVLGAASAKA
jgi:hypothetical protein